MAPTRTSFDPARFTRSYARAFAARDASRIAAFYHAPCLTVRGDGSVMVLETPEAATALFAQVLSVYGAEGMTGFEARDMEVGRPGPGLVVLTCSWDMLGKEGACLRSWRQSYTLRETPEGWRILLSLFHDG